MGYSLFATSEEVSNPDVSQGGMYSDLPVPCDLKAVIAFAEEYDNTADGRSRGFIFHLRSEGNEQYNGMEFRWYAPETEKAKFKMLQMLEACDMIPSDAAENGLDVELNTDMFGQDEVFLMMRVDYPWRWYKAKREGTRYDGKLSATGVAFREVVSVWKPADEAPPLPEWAEEGSEWADIDMDSPLPDYS